MASCPRRGATHPRCRRCPVAAVWRLGRRNIDASLHRCAMEALVRGTRQRRCGGDSAERGACLWRSTYVLPGRRRFGSCDAARERDGGSRQQLCAMHGRQHRTRDREACGMEICCVAMLSRRRRSAKSTRAPGTVGGGSSLTESPEPPTDYETHHLLRAMARAGLFRSNQWRPGESRSPNWHICS